MTDSKLMSSTTPMQKIESKKNEDMLLEYRGKEWKKTMELTKTQDLIMSKISCRQRGSLREKERPFTFRKKTTSDLHV